MLQKTKELPDFAKDTESKAVVNTSKRGLEMYREQREARRRKDAEINRLRKEVEDIKKVLGI